MFRLDQVRSDLAQCSGGEEKEKKEGLVCLIVKVIYHLVIIH